MMQRDPAFRVRVLFKHREIDRPERLPAFTEESAILSELVPQCAQRVVDDARLVCAEEDEITIFCTATLHDAADCSIGQELENRRLQSVTAFARVIDFDIRQSFGTVAANEGRVIVNFFAAEFAAGRQAQRGHAPFGVLRRTGEHLELHRLHEIRDLAKLERIPEIRLIRAESLQCLRICHARKRRRQFDIEHFLEHRTDQLLHDAGNGTFVDETHFQIELREFGLSIRAQVLVAETTHDLVIAVQPRHHQELLENLRRLRQCKKFARVGPAGDDVIAGSFRRRFRQHRRFDIDKAVLIEEIPHCPGHRMSQAQVGEHVLPAEIQVAKLEPQFLVRLFVMVKRRRLRIVQRLQFVRENLDLSGRHIRVHRTFGPVTHLPFDPQYVLTADSFGFRKDLRPVRIENDLQQSFPIPEVDKNYATVVATPVHPATDRDFLADLAFVNVSAVMGAHRVVRVQPPIWGEIVRAVRAPCKVRPLF